MNQPTVKIHYEGIGYRDAPAQYENDSESLLRGIPGSFFCRLQPIVNSDNWIVEETIAPDGEGCCHFAYRRAA